MIWRPWFYRGRHRATKPDRAAHIIEMRRIDDAEVAAEAARGIAALDAMLEEQSR